LSATTKEHAAVLDDVNWMMVASASALAAVLLILVSIACLLETPKNNNSEGE
jgi:uncharacterized membrane protein (DUF373 family)